MESCKRVKMKSEEEWRPYYVSCEDNEGGYEDT